METIRTQASRPQHKQKVDDMVDAMNMTFPDRRKEIVVGLSGVTAIKDLYPLLYSEQEVTNVKSYVVF